MCFSNTKNLYNIAQKEINNEEPDIIISCCNPAESLVVGSRLNKKYNKIKYYAYFLDSIFSGPIPSIFSEKYHDIKALKFEHKVLYNADGIIMMKAAEKKYLKNSKNIKFFDKIKFLDLPLYIPNENVTKNRMIFPSNQIVLFFAGSMPKNIRDPRFFLEVFSKAYNNNNSVHLYIAGKSDFEREIDDYCNNYSNIHMIGVQPHSKILEMYSEADFLVNLGNNLTGMVPSKIFEYMSMKKPLITTVRIDNDPSIIYYEYYGKSLILDENASLFEAVKNLVEFVEKMQNNVDVVKIQEDKLYNNTPVAFVNHIIEY